MTLLKAALSYARLGLSIIPVGHDKRPLIAWEKYQKERADEKQIREWFSKFPKMNIGAVTGEVSNLLAVDCDSQKGVDTFEEMLPENWQGPMQLTPRGGRHYLFRYHQGIRNNARILDGIDTRGEGGYIVIAPSTNGNGQAYRWVEGLSIEEVDRPEIPERYLSVVVNSSFSIRGGVDTANPCRQQSSVSSSVVKMFEQGTRDEDLFHAANCLVKGGMQPDKALQILAILALNCNPPYPEKDIPAKIQSALQRADRRERGLADEVRDWILSSSGVFLSSDVVNCLQLSSRDEKKNLSKILARLSDADNPERLLERYGNKNGCFRRLDTSCDPIDWMGASGKPFPILWPFDLQSLAVLFPKTIAVIAGAQNAGKTAFVLNVARLNMGRHSIRYVSSEMGPNELKGRLSKFDGPIEQWKAVDFRERSSNFADVVLADGLTIIDYFEISDQFWLIAEELKRIYEKLSGGVCVVCLQKTQGKDAGRGGDFGLEKPRLYVNLDQDPPHGTVLTIRKAKEWANKTRNPNFQKLRFKIIDGTRLEKEGEWYA